MGSYPKAKTRRKRLLALGAFTAFVVAAGLSGACSNNAVGVDACQAIEEARCDIAPSLQPTSNGGCQGVPKIKTPTEVQNCKILYRDHCRVGIENMSGEPKQGEAAKCVTALKALVNCEKNGTQDVTMCGLGASPPLPGGIVDPCTAFLKPEELSDCAFIASSSSTSSASSSSSTGAGGGSGG